MMDDKKNVTAFFLSTGVTVEKATSRFWRGPTTFLITLPLPSESTMASLWAATNEYNRRPAGRFTDISV